MNIIRLILQTQIMKFIGPAVTFYGIYSLNQTSTAKPKTDASIPLLAGASSQAVELLVPFSASQVAV